MKKAVLVVAGALVVSIGACADDATSPPDSDSLNLVNATLRGGSAHEPG